MATKPTQTAEWCSDENNLVEPSEGQKDTGWTDGQIGVSSYENWRANNVWQWLEYLDDGDFQGAFGLSSVITPGAISGTVNDWAPTGNATATTIVVDLSADATLTGIDNGVEGRILIVANGDPTFNLLLSVTTTSAAENRFVFPHHLLLAPGEHAVLIYRSTRWRLIATNSKSHGTETERISAYDGFGDDQATNWTDGVGYLRPELDAAVWKIPFTLPNGSRILNVRARVMKTNDNTPNRYLTVAVRDVDEDGSGVNLAGPTNTDTDADEWVTMAFDDIDEPIADGHTYYVSFVATEASTNLRINWIEVDYDRGQTL